MNLSWNDLSRERLGVNGEHSRLGNEITEAEFRGYIVAKIEEQTNSVRLIREELKDIRVCINDSVKSADSARGSLSARITVLEDYKNRAIGVLILVPLIISLSYDYLLHLIGLKP